MIKAFVRRAVRAAGYDIRRHGSHSDPDRRLALSLERFGVDLVLDVGANTGQFGRTLRANGYAGRIVSFEPLSTAHAQLLDHAANDPKWTVHPRCAIGSYNGTIDIHVAGNSVSSSALPMLEAHSDAAPASVYVGTEQVPVCRLDAVAVDPAKRSRNPFLKIDVQGMEGDVLDGAGPLLATVGGVLCELSLVPLYSGQRLWLEVIERLRGEGFQLWDLHGGFRDPRDGRLLQMDGLFFRSSRT